VDSAATFLSLLDNLINLAVDPPSLYLDLEGIKLSCHGSISIISLYVFPKKKIYFIDIHRLGKTAFLTTNNNAISFKIILESLIIPKIIFDIRNDSDTLFNHYEISVDGIKDFQLIKLATRKSSKDFVAGLTKCIKKDSPVSTAAKAEWQRTKEGANRLYDPKKGGRYEIFNERLIKSEIVQYCARDVALLPGLYNVYNAKLRLPEIFFWQIQIRETTKNRIKLSQNPDYNKQAEIKVCGS
jgi:exonuclease 3'-5' domain-containing protein 1